MALAGVVGRVPGRRTIDIESGRLGLRRHGPRAQVRGLPEALRRRRGRRRRTSRGCPRCAQGDALTVAPPPPPARGGRGALAGRPAGGGASEALATSIRPEQHFTAAAAALHRGVAGAGRSRRRTSAGRAPTRRSSTRSSRAATCRAQGRSLAPTDLGDGGQPPARRDLPDVFDVALHRTHGGGAGRHRGGQAGVAAASCSDLWDPLEQGPRAGREARARRTARRWRRSPTSACPNDGAMLVKKFGRRGPFLACPNYPECKYTRPVDGSELPTPVEGTCPLCGSGSVARNGPYGRFISLRARGPTASSPSRSRSASRVRSAARARSPSGAPRAARYFYGCTRYPDCTFAVWDTPRCRAVSATAARRSWSRSRPKKGLTSALRDLQVVGSSRRPSVREALEQFLTELETQRRASPHTLAAYRRDITRVLIDRAPADGASAVRAGQWTTELLERALRELCTPSAMPPRASRARSPRGASFSRFCVRRGMLAPRSRAPRCRSRGCRERLPRTLPAHGAGARARPARRRRSDAAARPRAARD